MDELLCVNKSYLTIVFMYVSIPYFALAGIYSMYTYICFLLWHLLLVATSHFDYWNYFQIAYCLGFPVMK
jgi:hypothetical protein